MVAFIYFAAMIFSSAAIGFLVHRWQRHLHWGWSVAVGMLLATVLTIGAGVVFLLASSSYPAADDPRFGRANSIYIVRETPVPGEGDPQRSEFLLRFPFEVRKGSDFEVRLLLTSAPLPIPAGDLASTLQGPRVLEVRPQRNCPSVTDQSSACIRLERSAGEATLVWDVTPTAEADPTVRVSLPAFWPSGDTWKARLQFDGRNAVFSPDPRCARNKWIESMEGGCGPVLPVVLDAHQPRFELTDNSPTLYQLPYAFRGAEVDLASNQLRFPIRITTSLGLNASTYAWLALAGTILSGFLGTGWAWKLLELFKPKPSTPAGAPAQSKPNSAPIESTPTPQTANNRQSDKRSKRRR
jgi:hypothetical protein